MAGPGGDPLHLRLKLWVTSEVASSRVVTRILAAERSKREMKKREIVSQPWPMCVTLKCIDHARTTISEKKKTISPSNSEMVRKKFELAANIISNISGHRFKMMLYCTVCPSRRRAAILVMNTSASVISCCGVLKGTFIL